jgi:hypothetical protein
VPRGVPSSTCAGTPSQGLRMEPEAPTSESDITIVLGHEVGAYGTLSPKYAANPGVNLGQIVFIMLSTRFSGWCQAMTGTHTGLGIARHTFTFKLSSASWAPPFRPVPQACQPRQPDGVEETVTADPSPAC